MFSPYDFALSYLTIPEVADEEEACQLVECDLPRFVSEIERRASFRRKWERALELRSLIEEVRRDQMWV